MKKLNVSIKVATLIITLGFLFTSCKRDDLKLKLPFKVKLQTWYRVSPASPSPVVVNGITYVSLANLVVGGDGHATSMGKVKSYANTLSYGTNAETPSTGGIGAPVNEVPGYPILGGPLPLIQTGDFTALPAIITKFHVPANVLGNTINLVLYNTKGDALFLSNISGTGTSTIISPTLGGYTNETLILGGAGKFIHATGELHNTGQFSFVAPYNGEDNYDGWIIL